MYSVNNILIFKAYLKILKLSKSVMACHASNPPNS